MNSHSRLVCCFTLVTSLVIVSPSAHADDEPVRRSGFTLGMAGGIMTGGARGTDRSLDGTLRTGAGFGNGGSFWLGGALTDWFTIGLGATGGGVSGSGVTAGGGAFVFRFEAFPLFALGDLYRDLGVVASFGTGGFSLENESMDEVSGGGTRTIGVGVFWEPLTFWRFSSGPSVEYVNLSVNDVNAHLVVIGMRIALYSGP